MAVRGSWKAARPTRTTVAPTAAKSRYATRIAPTVNVLRPVVLPSSSSPDSALRASASSGRSVITTESWEEEGGREEEGEDGRRRKVDGEIRASVKEEGEREREREGGFKG